jgi:hypothetical protein
MDHQEGLVHLESGIKWSLGSNWNIWVKWSQMGQVDHQCLLGQVEHPRSRMVQMGPSGSSSVSVSGTI